LASWGLHSILTVPTLAYCVGALEEIHPHANFSLVINNNLLYEAMADAALLTRLLNDVGTRLLTMNNEKRSMLYEKFHHYTANMQFKSIFSYLDFISEQKPFFYNLTRIRKDIKHGEFNICLDNLDTSVPIDESLVQFCKNIDYYAELYKHTFLNMQTKLASLSDTLGDDIASKVIANFVAFHEKKYSMEYESVRGDYAVTATSVNAKN